MTFISEAAFETALIDELKNKGWESEVSKNPTEADLLQNWAAILFQNNRDIDRLNDVRFNPNKCFEAVRSNSVFYK